VEFVHGNLDDLDALRRAVRGCDVTYHLAGKTSAQRRQELFHVNALGSYRVAQACASRETPPLLLMVSSLAAAGTSTRGRMQSEADLARPVSEYGRSKRAGELAALSWAKHVPLSIVRPGIVFGPGNREMLPMFQAIARWRVHAVPGFVPRRLSLIHQADLVEIISRIVSRGARVPADTNTGCSDEVGTGYYFAAAPEYPTYPELGRMIARAVRVRRTLILQLPEPFTWLAAAGNQMANRLRGRSDSFNLDKIREAFAGDWTSSAERVCHELQFKPTRSLQAQLNETADWYRKVGWL
jgi:nucleoside-diphosphate-sugar epimerase